MEQYIPKSALVAEIDKRLHQLTDAAFDSMIGRNLIEIKDFLDTLEVKEVNLDAQDIYNILILERLVLREVGDKECSNEEICKEVLKRFKAQKEE